ncbi:MAG: thermonuclease family protein [Candidatus Pacebacteria bacterium]|nr:thermonuclease family protein [Candidatus Paceibacterota bacterium]
MSFFNFRLGIFMLVIGIAVFILQSHRETRADGIYHVDRVVDGDTIVVSQIGENLRKDEEKIRLIGLNTPETVDPRKAVQCFGQEASTKAKAILEDATIRLASDPSQDAHDKYGRLLAYVFVQKATSSESSDGGELLFNQYMIEQGYGYEYTYNIPYLYQKQFKKAEKVARAEGKGLWAKGVCEGQRLKK